jgi:hypothetical protein
MRKGHAYFDQTRYISVLDEIDKPILFFRPRREKRFQYVEKEIFKWTEVSAKRRRVADVDRTLEEYIWDDEEAPPPPPGASETISMLEQFHGIQFRELHDVFVIAE